MMLRRGGITVLGVFIFLFLSILTACTNGSDSSVGGTVTGLNSGSSVVLQNNGGDSLAVSSNGGFVFHTGMASGSTYSVTVATQPAAQICEISNASGTMGTTPITNVVVSCALTNTWTWMSGSTAINSDGVYGTLGVPAVGNVPGSRYSAASWTDTSGNLWLFGGQGYNAAGSLGYQNDFWKFTPATNEWTWSGGSNGLNTNGTYGTQGIASVNNMPGSRVNSVTWTDPSGHFWLFGGVGYPASGNNVFLNDLWEFNPTSSEWTWVTGSNSGRASGVYGTQGTASSSNTPGARYASAASADSSGNLWLFGGNSYDSIGSIGYMNDLWKFNTSTNEWTWVSGSHLQSAGAVYGTQGTASAGNVPGARCEHMSWVDSSGNFWLFGGVGFDANGTLGSLNDLWKFNPLTNEWTWVSGANTVNASGVYGTLGVAAAGNFPGARYGSISWVNVSGNLWLFGGSGYNSTQTQGALSDLWEYNISSNQWTWVSGRSGLNLYGVYGTQGVDAASNLPGARAYSTSWVDTFGNLWMFGNSGFGAEAEGYLNDLWKYTP